MKRRAFFPLALVLLWLSACAHDITSPVTGAIPTSTSEAAVESFVTSSVVTGWLHSCALTSQGVAYCWGDNGYGQLGSERVICAPGITCTLTPTLVRGGLTFTSLSAGAYHTCGVTTSGELYCWGSNSDDQLGVATNEWCISGLYRCSSTPLRVGSGMRMVEAGFTHSCALTTGGQPYCWGGNLFGQLGVNDTNNRAAPTAVHGQHTFASIETGGYHSCALTASGVAYCWGANDKGQLGAPSSNTCFYLGIAYACHLTPLPVSGGLTFASLDLGHSHSCGIVSSAPSSRSAAASQRRREDAEPTLRLVSQTGLAPADFEALGAGAASAPAAPTNLRAQAVSDTRIDLQWTDNSGDENGFDVWRAQGGQYVRVARLAPNTTSYSDTGLQPSTNYTYGVLAFNGSGYSGASNTASARTGSLAPPNPPSPFVPAAPSSLRAQAVSDTRIDLQWTDNSGDENGFDVWRARAGQYVRVARLGPNTTSYSDTGLQPSTNYIYGVVAFNAAGNSAPSNPTNATTHATPPPPPPPPAAPSALQANAASSTQVNLAWTDNAGNEDGFRIERHAGDGNFTLIATVGPNVTSYTNGSLSEGTTYSYRVQAFNLGGASSWSNTRSATTWPHAPSNLAAQGVSSSQMNLSWSDNSQRESGYEVQRSTNDGPFTTLATLGANATSYSDRGLQAENSYSYRVRAISAGAASAWSSPAAPPGTPAGVTAYALSPTQIQLTWFDTSNNEEGFRIERHAGDGNFILIATVGPNVTTYINGSLNEGTAYAYRVQAFNASDASFWSRTASVWTWLNTPTNLAAQATSSSQINLSWNDNSQRETGYEIHRKEINSAFFPIATIGANATSYSDTGLQPGTTYIYRVRAIIVGIGSASAFSNEASATTHPAMPPPGGPAAPTNLEATLVHTNEIQLNWHPSPDGDGYSIERHAGDGAFTEIFRTGVTWYPDRDLQLGTTYTYRVRAYTLAGGLSAYSNEASASTPGPPSAGNAYCWGLNVRGQLGANSLADFLTTPTRVHGGLSFRQVTTGRDHSCGVAEDGAGYCWGWNGDGQFGNGGQGAGAGSRAPVPMGPGLTWQVLRGGDKHSCGISTASLTYCWGQNHRGQIGDGTRNNWRLLPTLVSHPSP